MSCRDNRWLIRAITMATCAICTGCVDSESPVRLGSDTSLVLMPIDSVVLSEPDSAPLAQPVDIFVRDTELFVADQASRRVHRYSRNGKLVQLIGQPGRGPGEFEAPFRMADVGDSLLVVAERGRRVLAVFNLSTGEHRIDVPHEGSVYGIASTGSGLTVGNVNPNGWSPLGAWRPGMESVISFGAMPTALLDVAMLPPMKMSIAVAPTPRGTAVLFSNVDSLFVYDDRGEIVSRVGVPAVRRRGVPLDAEARARVARDVSDRYEVLSTAAAVQQLSTGRWAVLHYDFSLVGRRLTAVGWISVLSSEGATNCVDVRLPISDDAMPSARLKGDTLFLLDQRVTDAGVESRLRSWLLDTKEC